MTENENVEVSTREVQKSRGNGALIGRFLAVGLFVALGTFAVIQSLSGDKPLVKGGMFGSAKDSDAVEPIDTESDNVPIVVSKSEFKTVAASTKPSMPPTPVVSKASGTFSRTLKPATTPVAIPPKKQASGTFGGPGAKTPPPNRIAQLPTGSARSTFGIGGPATATPPVVKPIGGAINSLTQKVSDATGNVTTGAVNRFNQLGNGIKSTASGVTERAKSAFGSVTSPGSTASRFSATTSQSKSETVSNDSPFGKRPAIKPIEAKSTLGSSTTRNPFASGEPRSGGFQSKSLNPISTSSTQNTRTPPSNPLPRTGSRFPAKQSGTPSALPRDPFSQSTVSRDSSKINSTFPPRKPANQINRSQLPSATSRAPVVQASRVSPKPGDRQYEGVQSPSMIIQKFSPREIQVNQTTDFEVKIRNVGRVAVDDVLVVDQIPEGARFIDANPKPSSQSRNGELKWQLGNMKPGEERTILLQLQPTEPGEIGSVAQFYFGSRATNRTKVTQPKLKISHTADPKILIGKDVVFDVIVENTGNGPAKDVIIQEEVPELLEYQDGSRELEYEIGTLQPGQSKRVQLGLRAARVGQLRSVMFASAKGGLQAKHETDVEVIAPKLTTTCKGPTTRFIKREVAHTFTVANKGTADATNLRLIARLPSGLRYVNSNNRGRYDRNSHSVIWQMRDLSAGGSGNVEIVTTPIDAGEQNIKFEASADLNQTSETVQNLNVKHLVDVFFDIDDVVDPIEIGGETSYRIRLVNQGTQSASNVQLQVDFPPGLQPTGVDSDLRNEIRGQQIVFENINSLRQGQELKIVVQATGRTDGDHRVILNMQADGRSTPVSKQETTRVYRDQ